MSTTAAAKKSTAAAKKFKVGDKVAANPNVFGAPAETLNRVFTVTKVNPKNYKCSADDGGRGINFPEHLLMPASEMGDAPSHPLARPFVPREFFVAGEVVLLKRAFKNWTTRTPMVVLADKGTKVNVAPLGGENDRYLRIPHAGLEKLSLEALTEILVDAS